MRGRKPASTALKIVRGERKASRLRPGAAFEPAPPDTPPPDWLPPTAAAEFCRARDALIEANVLASADVAALACYAATWAAWREATERVATEGAVIRGKRGMMKSPWQRIAETAARDALRLASELGLTPASRARVSPLTQAPRDPLAEFLGNGKPPPVA